MALINVLDLKGQKVEELQLKDEVFSIEPNLDVMYRYVEMQLCGRRQGTASTKTRAEVSGTGKKPWPQKHTGRARQGTLRGPHMRHGGVAFGPKPKDWSKKLPKKMKKIALRSALSARFKEENIIILDEFKMKTPKTKDFISIISSLGLEDKKILLVLPYKNEEYLNVRLSGKNVREVKIIIADNPGVQEGTVSIDGLNVFDIINNEKILLTKDTVKKIEEVLGYGN